MRESNKVAIGTLVMRNKEYPVAIRPDDEVLKLETMYFADEIRSPTKELPDLPDAGEVSEKEVAMAKLLLESMESEWDPSRYHDTHRQKVEELVEAKRQGDEIVVGTTDVAATNVADLMEVLSASIKSVKGGGGPAKGPAAGSKSSIPKKRAPAKKPAPTRKAPTSITAKTGTKAPGRRKAS